MRPIDDPKYQALALCPVCGNKDYLHFICDDDTDTNVMCANCGLQSAWADDCNTATEQWNKFAAPPLREGWVSVPRYATQKQINAMAKIDLPNTPYCEI